MWKHNKSWMCVRVCLRVCQRMRLERRHETFRFYRYHFCLSSCMTNGTEERAGKHHQKGEQLTVFRKGIKLPFQAVTSCQWSKPKLAAPYHPTNKITHTFTFSGFFWQGQAWTINSFFFHSKRGLCIFCLPNYHHAVSPFKTLLEIILKTNGNGNRLCTENFEILSQNDQRLTG